ncbi:hypothetical protein N331_01703, partial [Merops nubicus]
KEVPGVKSASDAAHNSCDSTLLAEDSCALLKQDACLPATDHHFTAAASLLRPEASPVNLEEDHSAKGSYCSDESADEWKLHQQTANPEVPALSKLQQIEGEAVVFPDILAADSFSNSLETEGIDILADVTQRFSGNSVDPNLKDWEKEDALFVGKVEACFGTAENHSNHVKSDTAPSASQVVVANSESSSDVETGAVLKPENSSIRNDEETCESMESQSSKGNTEKKIDTLASVSEADGMLPPSKLEMSSVSKGDQGSQQANTYISDKLSIGCLISSSLAGLKSKISSDDDSKEYQISGTASHRKTVEGSRPSADNVKSPLKTASAKPVRFTIAPAWQRSLSGGSNSKEDSYNRSSPTSPIRPEWFEGVTKEHTRFDVVIQESEKNNSDRFDQDCKGNDWHLNSSVEWANNEAQIVENPFGVRLRRTSSLLKYQNESRAESPKLIPSVVPTASSAAVKEDQKSVGTKKPPPGLAGSTKLFVKKPDLLEDKIPPKTISEEVAKKQNIHKPPAWVSMAKLKQKGFQDHPLAKEHKAEDKALTKVDQEEVEYHVMLRGWPGKVGPIAQEASAISAVEKEAK